MAGVQMSVLHAKLLDLVAEGKTPRDVEQITGIPAAEVHRIADQLLRTQLNLDTEAKRALQVYRLEKIIESLWSRVQQHADRDDVRNLIEVMDRINDLLALHKEREAEELQRVTQHQSALYISSLRRLLRDIAMMDVPTFTAMTGDDWDEWAAKILEQAKEDLTGFGSQVQIEN